MSRLRTISETILALERERDREEEALRGARYTVGPGRSSYALLQQRQTTPRALFGQWVTRYTPLPLFLELWLTWSPPSLLQLFARERIVLLDRISNYYKHSLDFFQAGKVKEGWKNNRTPSPIEASRRQPTVHDPHNKSISRLDRTSSRATFNS